MKLRVKLEHCEADGGKKVTNDARAEQMMDTRIKVAVNINLGMIGRMVVLEYMQMGCGTMRRVRALTT